MASFVLTLARETGWSEAFILHELPLSRALQYRHCIARAAGYWTVPASADPATQLATLRHLAPTPASLPPPAEKDAVAAWIARHV